MELRGGVFIFLISIAFVLHGMKDDEKQRSVVPDFSLHSRALSTTDFRLPLLCRAAYHDYEKNKKQEHQILMNTRMFLQQVFKKTFRANSSDYAKNIVSIMTHIIELRRNSEALSKAISNKYVQEILLQWLQDNFSIDSKKLKPIFESAQKIAARKGSKELLLAIAELSEPVRKLDSNKLIVGACYNKKHPRMLSYLIGQNNFMKPSHRRILSEVMFNAAATNDKKLMDKILCAGLPVNATTSDNYTPMNGAIMAHNIDGALFLLEKRADPNTIVSRTGKTPLQVMLEDNLWYYQPSLMKFYEKNNVFNFVKRLLESGANVNILRHSDHSTVLHILAQQLHHLKKYFLVHEIPPVFEALVRLFFVYGINPSLRSREHANAIQYSIGLGEDEFADIISKTDDERKIIEVAHPIFKSQGFSSGIISLIVGYLLGFNLDPYSSSGH